MKLVVPRCNIAADYCYTRYTFRGLSMCMFVLSTPVSSAKTAEPIEME